uniref:Uncharacterized protein n=1 Tax=Arundo donax TaxID=35708 RepID=A0A0A8YRE9_ARUDO
MPSHASGQIVEPHGFLCRKQRNTPQKQKSSNYPRMPASYCVPAKDALINRHQSCSVQ